MIGWSIKILLGVVAAGLLNGCAVLHHVQIGDIDNRRSPKSSYFDVKVSETGVSLDEAADVAKAFSQARSDDIEQVRTALSLFQQGPRTGNPVYNETYARKVGELIAKECPSGRVTELRSIRETRKYPVISGEIVKITGRCVSGEN